MKYNISLNRNWSGAYLVRHFLRLFLCTILLLNIGANAAPLFEPTRFFMYGDNHHARLTLFNNENYDVTWSIKVVKWHIDSDGNEQLVPTDDLQYSPNLIALRPHSGADVLFHARALDISDSNIELSYRILLESTHKTTTGTQATYKFSLPVFIMRTPERRSIRLDAHASTPGRIAIAIYNEGNVHDFIEKIRVSGSDSKHQIFEINHNGWYLLPNNKIVYYFNISFDDCIKSHKIITSVFFKNSPAQHNEVALPLNCNGSFLHTEHYNPQTKMTTAPSIVMP